MARHRSTLKGGKLVYWQAVKRASVVELMIVNSVTEVDRSAGIRSVLKHFDFRMSSYKSCCARLRVMCGEMSRAENIPVRRCGLLCCPRLQVRALWAPSRLDGAST